MRAGGETGENFLMAKISNIPKYNIIIELVPITHEILMIPEN